MTQYQKRKAAGLCGSCGCRSPAKERATCEVCLERTRQSASNYYAREAERVKTYQQQYRLENRPLIAARNALYRASNPDVKKRKVEWRRFVNSGWLPGEYSAALEAQQGRCAICLKSAPKLAADHDHTTERKRELLCTGCNTSIAQFENVSLAKLQYLAKHESPALRRVMDEIRRVLGETL